jgi:hypothetical protein
MQVIRPGFLGLNARPRGPRLCGYMGIESPQGTSEALALSFCIDRAAVDAAQDPWMAGFLMSSLASRAQ